ncbi:hypothetical protein MRX96_000567 [Rhipicephalus microplus]
MSTAHVECSEAATLHPSPVTQADALRGNNHGLAEKPWPPTEDVQLREARWQDLTTDSVASTFATIFVVWLIEFLLRRSARNPIWRNIFHQNSSTVAVIIFAPMFVAITLGQ